MSGGGYGGGMGGGSSGAYTPRGGFQYQPQTGGMSPIPQRQAPQPNYTLGGGAPRYGPSGDPNSVNLTGFGKEYTLGNGSPMYGQDPSNPDAVNFTGFRGQNPLAAQAGMNTAQFMGFGQQDSAPGVLVNQRASAPQQQSFEQFAATLGNNGMTSGQINDLYQKSLQPQSGTNFWANTGVGTQQPAGFQTPENWGKQTYGFDPRAMAGKQVGADMAWYYGRDAIGRNINNQGDAVAGFTGPADGFQRRRPWM